MPPVRRPPRRASLVTALVLSLVVVSMTAGPVGAAPPPKSICGICGDSLDGSTGDGTLEIRIDEAGDSRWIARVPVDEAAADRYRSNATLLETAVADAWYRYDVAEDDAMAVEPRVEDGTVVVEYTVEDVASDGVADTQVFEYLYAAGTHDRYELRAEAVTIRVPDGYEVTNDPPNAVVEDRTVTWSATTASGIGGVPTSTYVTYADDTAVFASWATAVFTFGPAILHDGSVAATVPVSVLFLATAVIDFFARRFGDRSGLGHRLCRRTGIDSVTGAVANRLRRRGVGLWELLAGSVIAAVGVGVVSLGTVGLYAIFGPVAFTLAVTLFLPFGYALGTGRPTWPYGVAISLTPAIPIVAFAPYATTDLVALLFVGWALVAAALGVPLVWVGRRVAVGDSRDGEWT